jgi:hypothetical protein
LSSWFWLKIFWLWLSPSKQALNRCHFTDYQLSRISQENPYQTDKWKLDQSSLRYCKRQHWTVQEFNYLHCNDW